MNKWKSDVNLTFSNIYRDINAVYSSQWWWTIKKNRYQGLISFQSGKKHVRLEWEEYIFSFLMKNIHNKEFIKLFIARRSITMEHAKCLAIMKCIKMIKMNNMELGARRREYEDKLFIFLTKTTKKQFSKAFDFVLQLHVWHGK